MGDSKDPSSSGPDPAAIPAGRTMPKEERLRPPAWPGGRAQPPDPEFRVIGIALDQPSKERTMAVITFAGGFIDKGQTKPTAARQY